MREVGQDNVWGIDPTHIVSIGLGLNEFRPCKAASRAGNVINHDRHAQGLFQIGLLKASLNVRLPSGIERDNVGDWLGGNLSAPSLHPTMATNTRAMDKHFQKFIVYSFLIRLAHLRPFPVVFCASPRSKESTERSDRIDKCQ